MDVHTMAEMLKKEGQVTLNHAGGRLTLNMSHRHERLYAIKLLTGMAYPQADIDTEITSRFIKNGDRVLDAGANIGFTALEFLQAGAAHVTALEPVSSLYARLKHLRSPIFHPRSEALAANIGRASIYVSEDHNQGSSLSESIKEYFPNIFGSQKEEVTITTIDAMMSDGLIFDVWKLDIEGAEVDALRGARATFSEHPPRVIIAEIYDPFLKDFIAEIPKEFTFRRRAYLGVEGYQLILQQIDEPIGYPVHHHSPMYVFARDTP